MEISFLYLGYGLNVKRIRFSWTLKYESILLKILLTYNVGFNLMHKRSLSTAFVIASSVHAYVGNKTMLKYGLYPINMQNYFIAFFS